MDKQPTLLINFTVLLCLLIINVISLPRVCRFRIMIVLLNCPDLCKGHHIFSTVYLNHYLSVHSILRPVYLHPHFLVLEFARNIRQVHNIFEVLTHNPFSRESSELFRCNLTYLNKLRLIWHLNWRRSSDNEYLHCQQYYELQDRRSKKGQK